MLCALAWDPGAEEDLNELRKYNLLRSSALHDLSEKDQKHSPGIEPKDFD